MVSVLSSEPAHGPLDPNERKSQEKESQEIGDHEIPAAIASGLSRESQEVA
jgi:hypothetical protein